MIRSEFIAKDGKKISYIEWYRVENPVAVIQISHGMAEHAMRYDLFAKEMNKRGFIVVAEDHRAHGYTDKQTPGYSDGDIWENTLSDLTVLADKLKEKYNLPLFIFGHSYGSFLTQSFIRRYNGLSGAVIGGSNYLAGASVALGKTVARMGMKFKGEQKPCEFVKKLTFDAYNKKYADGTTFISSLISECKRYEADENCNFVCSNNFYYSFFGGAQKLYKQGGRSLKDFPILLVAGDGDPVGNMGKGVIKLENWYKKQGACVKSILYKGVRHEYLNDTSREQVINDIADFYLQILAQKG